MNSENHRAALLVKDIYAIYYTRAKENKPLAKTNIYWRGIHSN